jgi:hypothetical protein
MKFSIGAILNAYDGRLLTTMDDVYKVLSFMTGEVLFTHQLPRAIEQCRPEIARQLTWLESLEMKTLQGELTNLLNDQVDVRKIIDGWLADCATAFGAEHELQPLVIQDHRDPIQEAVDLFGPDKVHVVSAPRGGEKGD